MYAIENASFLPTRRRPDDKSGLFSGLPALMARIRNARRNRKAIAKLLDFDDRMLADIGLTRGDVEIALAVPWWEDPGRRLARSHSQRAEANRAAEQRVRDRNVLSGQVFLFVPAGLRQ